MTKFRTDVTKGGHKILSLHGPDGCGEYAGVVDTGGSYLTITWCETGVPVSANDLYNLIQLDETKPDHKIEARLEALEERLQTLEQRTKTDEKGVWVTTKTFWDACWSQVSVKGEPLEDLFERMAKQLGLEE